VVVIQLFEFFAWRGERSVGFAAAFFAANVLQVVAVFIALAVVCEDAHRAWLVTTAGVVVAAYLGVVITAAVRARPFKIPRHRQHLVYPWWETGYEPGTAYIAALIVVFLCIGRPWKWSLPTLGTILVALLASFLFYRQHIASMWCFFVVLIPILFYAYSLW
jgi:hypothetical protein